MNNSFEQKELDLLRKAIDQGTKQIGKLLVQSDDVKKIINILENFIRTNKTLCYGGTAINDILPEQDKFYNRSIEIPDYDFFSPFALEYSKKLADIYYKEGFIEVETKSGTHIGTYKVYVNFLPIADITYLEPELFNSLMKNSIKINAINYCPPNFLRMAIYKELSHPMGDISRWEKILKRLIILNKNYPLKGHNCHKSNFQRKYEGNIEDRNKIYNIVRKSVINQDLVFFGGYALSLYSKYMPYNKKKQIQQIPDFDILSNDPLLSCNIIKQQLEYEGYNEVFIEKKKNIGEFVDEHYEISVKNNKIIDVIATIYKTNGCYSYNSIFINKEKINIATIDTILSFYLIFIYANRPYYDINRLICMSEYLFKVQLHNRLEQKGLLKRFTIKCYGKEKTKEDIRAEKSNLLKELKDKKKSKEYEKYFLRYIPSEIYTKKQSKTKKIKKKRKISTNKSYLHLNKI